MWWCLIDFVCEYDIVKNWVWCVGEFINVGLKDIVVDNVVGK